MSSSDIERPAVRFAHTISESGRLLPSSSQWNSSSSLSLKLLMIHFLLHIQNPLSFNSLSHIKKYFKRFIYVSGFAILLVLALVLLMHFLPHKHAHHGTSRNLTLAISQALTFFDAQKSGNYPSNSPVKFQGDSGLQDGNSTGTHDLDIIKWGSDYLLKLFVPSSATASPILYSQVGSANNDSKIPNDINCNVFLSF
ncbi:hypothetical protein ACB092_01G132200 [Castanea dentata]